ncbi:phosphoribosyltransferase [Flavobacterium gawalongense]|uniref:Phosphoribosyltransferase n=1 Tax=Flavobacterium gawalongense TaxID=2594432 RepID=A0A553BL65_9FLAO|nr:phosphoribosyltransferase family protein [Flavobacterium gawalongense]TRX00391.1 phosphoribosyltransferase [Flavobacterium gawalongense]TRX05062.1 phosphoribosyltransferase [Flavobacterium gawalongense]TRX08981.1 phosphoribosyltransferase [Flavobacterium gawalongense]TRX10032.1 phosphoribosyltransferase [Flavobacterium gawalongense]TRX26935.1 phosphoribosyltransferase [Flavobacterium gawalongense]
MYNEILKDRIEAGLLLAEKLKKYQNSNTIVLAVPRGGVPIGSIIAKSLQLPLDIVLSKKIGHPYNKEFAIGAVSMDSMIIDEHPEIPQEYIDDEIIRLRKLLRGKYELYMGNREPLDIKEKNVILVDDGIATGNTLLASISMLRKRNPAKIIVAVPVLPYDTVPVFEKNTDEFVYLIASKYFRGVGGFYEDFNQVEDDEVIKLLSVTRPIE